MAQTGKTVSSEKRKPRFSLPLWTARSNYYVLEFIIALVGIGVLALLIDRMIFVLLQFAADESSIGNGLFEGMNLPMVAMGLVWLPIAVLFFKRSRTEEINRPEVAQTKLRRFFLYLFMFGTLLAAASFAFVALHSVLQVIFSVDDPATALVAVTLPALLAALLHAFIFVSFMQQPTLRSIKCFIIVVGTIGVIVTVVLLLVSGIRSRSIIVDEKIKEDLRSISAKISNDSNNTGDMPQNLHELGLDREMQRRADRYGYTYSADDDGSYKLCANFKTDTLGDEADSPVTTSYRYDPNFYLHGKGNYCFSGTVKSPYPANYNYNYSDMFNSLYNAKSSDSTKSY